MRRRLRQSGFSSTSANAVWIGQLRIFFKVNWSPFENYNSAKSSSLEGLNPRQTATIQLKMRSHLESAHGAERVVLCVVLEGHLNKRKLIEAHWTARRSSRTRYRNYTKIDRIWPRLTNLPVWTGQRVRSRYNSHELINFETRNST